MTITLQERAAPGQAIAIRPVTNEADWAQIAQLRETIYVQQSARIGGVDGMAETFDRYNAQAHWLLAEAGGQPLGTVKIIRDSENGLPFEVMTGAWPKESGEVFAEIGHLLTLPGVSAEPVVMALMRAAFAHAVNDLGATHLVGDVFVDRTRGDAFYRRIGFQTAHGPYRDGRFLDAPMSMVMLLRVADLPDLMQRTRGLRMALLRYLTADWNRTDAP